MTFGEKLQQLRKAKGLSQEQLAGQLQLTRQAVSRWELNETMPDTENVIRLARFFGVSTDYLLLDEIQQPPRCTPPAQETPPLPPAENTPGQIRLRTSMVGGLCVCAMGLIEYIIALISHTPEVVVAGLVLQIFGVFLFELIGAIYNGSWERRVRFYSAACWLLAPMPLYVLIRWLFRLKSWVYPSAGPWVVFYLAYLAVCASFTMVLRHTQNNFDG